MTNNLRITLIQSSLHWENISANLEMFSEKIQPIVDTDLMVLPETFSTGFSMNPKLAEKENGLAVNWMKKTAAEKSCVVTGSLMIEDDNHFYNRLFWVHPDGSYQTYDKRHLFSLSDEPKFFTPGTKRLIVELKGWKICPMICYDLRFPAWARNLHAEYDVLLYVANWPQRRAYAWKHLLLARAIENQCYTVGVGRVGNDANDVYHSGDSMVVDGLGNVIYHRQDEDDITTIELDFESLATLREQLPFLKDADEFILNPKEKFKSH